MEVRGQSATKQKKCWCFCNVGRQSLGPFGRQDHAHKQTQTKTFLNRSHQTTKQLKRNRRAAGTEHVWKHENWFLVAFFCSQTWTRSLAKKACTSWRCLPCTVRPVFPYSAVCGHNLGSIDPNVRLDLFSWLGFFLNFCFSCAWMELNLASCYDFSPPGSTNMFFKIVPKIYQIIFVTCFVFSFRSLVPTLAETAKNNIGADVVWSHGSVWTISLRPMNSTVPC